MNIEIKRLTPDLAEDYLHFFDVTPHDDNIVEHKCYCVCWCSADHRIATDFSSRDKRRELARQYVREGVIQGFLAYDGDRIVGWCNANAKSECLHCTSWLRNMKSVDMDDKTLKIKSVFCFVIAPDMRRKGVATQLLERVCEDAKADDFDIVEAYPNKAFVSTSHDFMGTVGMYEKTGFTTCYKTAEKLIMQKALK